MQNATRHTENGQWVASDIFGVEYVICPYNGTVQENTAPATGWGAAQSAAAAAAAAVVIMAAAAVGEVAYIFLRTLRKARHGLGT